MQYEIAEDSKSRWWRASRIDLSDKLRSAENLEIIRHLEQGLEVQDSPELGNLVRPSDMSAPIQRWFKYREGYTLELCKRLLAGHDVTRSLVLDPFCGFGTTTLAARQLGHQSVGLDVNPLAAFVARVKTRTYSQHRRQCLRKRLRDFQGLTKRHKQALPPSIRILPKLFHKPVLEALLIIRHEIERTEKDTEREFFLLAWVSILEQMSNVYKEGNGLKYRNRQRRGNVYSVTPHDEWAKKRFPKDAFQFALNTFLSKANEMLSDSRYLLSGYEPTIVQGDAQKLSNIIPDQPSYALFSPPYCNCFNYIKAYKLELWMSGLISEYSDIGVLTKAGIRSRLESLTEHVKDPYPQRIDDLIALMPQQRLWATKIPELLKGYFADMGAFLTELYGTLQPGGQCTIVVGTSAYAGVLVPTDLILARLAQDIGYDVECLQVARPIPTSSQQRRFLDGVSDYSRESLVFLRR